MIRTIAKVGLSLALAASLVGCASVGEKQAPVAPVYVQGNASSAQTAEAQPDRDGGSPLSLPSSTLDEAPVEVAAEGDAPGDPPLTTAETFVSPPGEEGIAPREVVGVHDPWESFNRRMHRFNNAVDRSVARPVARAYVKVVPTPVRTGVSNFFDNLGQPATAVNSLLQGKVKHSAQALGRFLVNSTVGVAGLFDPASRMKIPEREEDFGQTLATWGWRRSRYVELPFFGPSTVRDAIGIAGDSPLQPVSYVEADKVRVGLMALNLVDVRTRLMAFDSLRDEASDDYLLVRDTWSQRRNFQIKGDTDGDEALPDYLKE